MTTNEMDARLLSQGEQVTSLADGALIPVAEGEGQPQKNIPFASLVDAVNGKDNEIATASTMEYVRGLDANGNPIMINKADLASVVAGLMGLANLRIRRRVTNYAGANVYHSGLSSSSITYVVQESDRSKYILSHTYYKLDSSDRVYQNIIANNELTFGNSNTGGTQIIEGATGNVIFYIMYFV